MVDPFEIKLVVTTLGTDPGLFVQTDRLGLNTTYEEKHSIFSFINITIFNRSANFFLPYLKRAFTLTLSDSIM